MNRKAVTMAAVALLVLGASGVVWAQAAGKAAKKPQPAEPTVATLGKPAPDFALSDHTGKVQALSGFRGKTVVLEWMNPDCPYSKRHYTTPTMKDLAAKYAPKGVVWLAINTTHYWTTEKNAAWVKEYELPYPILNDQSGYVGRLYGAKTTPDMRIIDAKGVLVYAGAIDDDSGGRKASSTNHVAAALDELLAGEKVSTPNTRPYGCTVKYGTPPPNAAPGFTLADHTGKAHSLAAYRGRIVVLEWVNPDCPISRRHYTTPTMKNLATKYAPKGVVWLAINTTHYLTSEKNAEWVKKHKLPYPILNDQSGEVGGLYGAKTTPDMRIIDGKGGIVYAGAIDDDPRGRKEAPINYVAKALDELLAGKKVSTPKTRPYGCTVKYAKKTK